MHEPLFLKNSGKNSIIVFIHGFMGSPRQFDMLAHSAYSHGYSAYSLLLPGHGSTARDFSSTTMDMWQTHVDAEIGRVAFEYDSVFIVGHSMGCLLALNTAVMQKGHICGLFLIACPMVLKGFSLQSLKVRLKQVFFRKSHPVKAAYLTGSGVPLVPSLIWLSTKPAVEVKKLTLLAKHNLQDIDIPVTVICSSSDELVSLDSLRILKIGLRQSAFDSITLSDSYHAYFPEHERSIIESALLSAVDR